MNNSEIDLRSGLLQIGIKSIFIINETRSGKNNIWESAIEINKIAKKLHSSLEEEETKSRKEDPTQWG